MRNEMNHDDLSAESDRAAEEFSQKVGGFLGSLPFLAIVVIAVVWLSQYCTVRK